MPVDADKARERRLRASRSARGRGVGALLLSAGPDLIYLCGHDIHPSERLTCLIVDAGGASTLVVPELEAPRARSNAPGVELRTWGETDDPIALVAGIVPRAGDLAVDDRMWSAFLLRLEAALPGRRFVAASAITGPLRMLKDPTEIEALRTVSHGADRAYAKLREVTFGGRAEREIAADISSLLRDEGHDAVSFTIVASGPNGASPHHGSGDRRIVQGDAIVLDFGGTQDGYCSDVTRTVHVGHTVDPEVRRVHDIVLRAQEAGYRAAREGTPAGVVDATARAVIDEAGFGRSFIHRLGHGIGLDGHEPPYLVRGNAEPLAPGMAFSLEPGIYLPGRFGIRIEDIAFIDASGAALPLNQADRSLAIVR